VDVPSKRRRALWVLLGAFGSTLAWAVLTIALTTSSAHADTGTDDHESPRSGSIALIGTATDALGAAHDSVAATMNTVADAAADTAGKLPAATSAGSTARDAVAPVVTTVNELAHSSAVTAATKAVARPLSPVVRTVEKLPAAGDIVATLDVEGTLGAVTAAVDDTVASAGEAVIAPVTDPLGDTSDAAAPMTPAVQSSSIPVLHPTVTTSSSIVMHEVVARLTGSSVEGPASVAGWPAWGAEIARTAATVLVASTAAATAIPPDVPSALAAMVGAQSLSSGSAGAAPGTAAIIATSLFFAHRAWMRRHRLNHHRLRAAPVLGMDVSPD